MGRVIVAFNGGNVDSILKNDVVDSLTNSSTDKPLSANQGKILNTAITNLKSTVNNQQIPASRVTTGTFPAKVVANANATSSVGTAQVRNISGGTQTPTTLTSGAIYIQYK